MRMRLSVVLFFTSLTLLAAEPLPDTQPLESKGDFAALMVNGIHSYLSRATEEAERTRSDLWRPDFSSIEAYGPSIAAKRELLARILGVVDQRLPINATDPTSNPFRTIRVAESDDYSVYAVSWPVFAGVDGEGLLLVPNNQPQAVVIAIPDADFSPEMLVGLEDGIPSEAQFARRFAENGCVVLIPTIINRADTWSGSPELIMTNQPHREFIYRMSYQLGRHIIGYEIQKILAAIDWLSNGSPLSPSGRGAGGERAAVGTNSSPLTSLPQGESGTSLPIGVMGYGEGGLLATYCAALDDRIKVVAASGSFGPRKLLWEEPIYRNVWGLLKDFGPTELGMLILPRRWIVEITDGPNIDGPPPPHSGRVKVAAPGRELPIESDVVHQHMKRLNDLCRKLSQRGIGHITESTHPGSADTLKLFLGLLTRPSNLAPAHAAPKWLGVKTDSSIRLKRQFDQLINFTQGLARRAHLEREKFWAKADRTSLEGWQRTSGEYRKYLSEEQWGQLPEPELPMNPRSRMAYDEPKWTGYEVMLDLYPDVFAYGVLLLPKDMNPDEKRPVVVAQHGLEGRPEHVVNPSHKSVYNSFAAQLADRGYIVFAPQNPYTGGNTFRQIQRRANPLKLSIFSFIVRQHERILDWLGTLPYVDADRIGFYGLSYGGETAMRVPPILKKYALSICSADFNEFVWKTTTLEFRGSYMLFSGYEIFDFNMANRFSHAEMAWLMAPRPFMVERGHDDGVGLDQWVAYEYARVRRHYVKIGKPKRTAIEFFSGGHEINGQGAYEFLDQFLRKNGD